MTALSELRVLPIPLADDVRPGDSLRLRCTFVETRRSRSKPDRGLVRTSAELINQNNEIVLTLTAMNLIRTRNPT